MDNLKLIEAAEVAEALFGDRNREARIYELARQGLLPCVRLGRRVFFSREAVAEFVRSGGRAFEGGWRREPRAQSA